MDFLILESLTFFPFIKCLFGDFLSCSRKDCVLSNTSLQLFKLGFDLMAFRLLFVKFSLKFACHFVITILSFLEVDTYLMHISKRVEVLVLIHLDIWLFIILLKVRVHHDNLLLQFFVFSSKLILFS